MEITRPSYLLFWWFSITVHSIWVFISVGRPIIWSKWQNDPDPGSETTKTWSHSTKHKVQHVDHLKEFISNKNANNSSEWQEWGTAWPLQHTDHSKEFISNKNATNINWKTRTRYSLASLVYWSLKSFKAIKKNDNWMAILNNVLPHIFSTLITYEFTSNKNATTTKTTPWQEDNMFSSLLPKKSYLCCPIWNVHAHFTVSQWLSCKSPSVKKLKTAT